MEFRTAVFERINKFALEKNLTLSQLAIRSGMTPSTLYGIKSNITKLPSLLSLKRLCDGLGITLAEFFDCQEINDSELI